MELKELKKTWDKLRAKNQLNEEQLKGMLGKRTKSLIERIERNIKIGFVVLLLLILIFALDDFILSPLMLESVSGDLEVPRWLLFLGIFSNALIFTTFIYFSIEYYRVKKSCDVVCNLKETLVKIIKTLQTYQRMFFLALIAVTLTMAIGFITGMYQGTLADFENQGIAFSDVKVDQIILAIFIGLIFLLVSVGGIFILLRWGFRRLYGNYIQQLKLTLNELEEIKE